jgi:hypothetical protein
VEGILNKNHKHIYPKRRFYIDEDSWRAHAAEHYDAKGTLIKSAFIIFIQGYDVMAPFNGGMWDSHLSSGISFLGRAGSKGWIKTIPPQPEGFWVSESMVSGSVR